MNNIWILTTIAVGIGLITIYTDPPALAQFGLGLIAIICAIQAVRITISHLRNHK